MEQQFNIRTSLDKTGLIHNLPIEFFVNNRRPIKFKCPTIKDSLTELDFKSFVGLLSLNPEQIKENNINLLVKPDNYGNLAIGLLFDENYSKYIVGYFLKYIDKSEYKDKTLYINDVKVITQELEYIVETIMISVGRKQYKEDVSEQKKVEEENPIMAKILAAQREADEKLKKKKQKQKSGGKGYTIEEIMLSVSYELGFSMDYLLNLNYYALIWYFGFAAKVDAHKLNQMILSSGMSKQKSYSYWLNK